LDAASNRAEPLEAAKALREIILSAVIFCCLSVHPATAEDLFRKLPVLAQSFGDIVPPTRIAIPNGVPISSAFPPPQPNPEAFRRPASTANARPGVDPFTNSTIPVQ
jgi:hypothetical protein